MHSAVHWGTGTLAPLDFQLIIFWSLQSRTNSDIRLHVVVYPVNSIEVYSFVTVYCMNFVIFLCVTLTLFSLCFVPLLAPNPGDATVAMSLGNERYCSHCRMSPA